MTTYSTSTAEGSTAPLEDMTVIDAARVANAVVSQVCRAVIGKRDVVR
jgi:hypothetical protein